MAKYGKKFRKSVKEAMHKIKRGKLTSGKSSKKVKSRKQAIAIGLSEARAKGAKVSPKGSKSQRGPSKRSSKPQSRKKEEDF
jgi:hypothetical protein